jgi:serine/threonine protein kinase
LALFEKIRNAESLVMPAHFSESAVDLIRRFLRVDPTRRLGHTKGGIQEIKQHPFFADINWQVHLATGDTRNYQGTFGVEEDGEALKQSLQLEFPIPPEIERLFADF